MRLLRYGIVLLFSTMVMVSGAFAQDMKVGVIDFDRVLKESKGGKAAKAEIESRGKSIKGTLEKQEDELEKMKNKLEAEALVMSQEKRESQEREFRIKVNDFKSLQKKYAKDFKMFEAEVIKRIQKEVFDLVEDLGKQGQYDLIVERSMALYFKDSLDITDQLIKAYDRRK